MTWNVSWRRFAAQDDNSRYAGQNMTLLERLKYHHETGDGNAHITCGEAMAEIERLRAIIDDACEVLRHYDLPEHAFHYEQLLKGR